MRAVAVGGHTARFSVVQAAGQLPEQEEVGAAQDLRLERPRRFQPRPDASRPQVGVESQLPADPQEGSLGTLGRRRGVEGGIADRTQQDTVRLSRGVERRTGQRRQPFPERRAANRARGQCELVIEALGDHAEDTLRRSDDFGTDAVTGQQQD